MKHLNQIVEKLKEASFFLNCMVASHQKADELNYYFSAFSSAARSVTFVMQYVGKEIEGFVEWYAEVQERLSQDPIAKYLLEARNETQKRGTQPIASGVQLHLADGESLLVHYFSYVGSKPPAAVPETDVVSTCSHQMKNLVRVVSEFFERFEGLVWSEERERMNTMELLVQLKSAGHCHAPPDEVIQAALDAIKSPDFKIPRPSHALQALEKEYAER